MVFLWGHFQRSFRIRPHKRFGVKDVLEKDVSEKKIVLQRILRSKDVLEKEVLKKDVSEQQKFPTKDPLEKIAKNKHTF